MLLGENETSAKVLNDITMAPVSDKMKTLLVIAAKVREGGKQVTDEAIDAAKAAAGATDIEIHDTVLIAALFCLYNRYVGRVEHFYAHRSAVLWEPCWSYRTSWLYPASGRVWSFKNYFFLNVTTNCNEKFSYYRSVIRFHLCFCAAGKNYRNCTRCNFGWVAFRSQHQ